MLIFASNLNAMTNSLVDNNGDMPITPLSEFVDSVFSELSSQYNEWNGYSEGVYYCVDNIDSWKNTLIPFATRLYKLTQTDDMVYWWLLQLMSQVDICKDRKEDFRKKDVFDVLSQLNLKHRTIILENTVQKHAEELQKALDEKALDAFRSMLPIIDDDETIYKTGRVLKRAIDVRDIYEKTMTHMEGDALGRLYVLFRRYYYYFSDAYKKNHRACDGMAKNVFLSLYQTQYRNNKISFCDIADNIGNLWVSSLIIANHNHNTQMPLAVRELLSDVLLSHNTSDKYGELYDELDNYDTDEQKEALIEEYGGWLKLERYSFIYRFLEEEHIKIKPPFSCKCTDEKHIRSVRVSGNMEHRKRQYRDNCYPYLESKNAIPMEELKAVSTSEVPANVEMANRNNGSVVNTKVSLYPESKWGFVPDDYFKMRPSGKSEEYFNRERFEDEHKAKELDCFAELINYLAEKGCISNNNETKALLAYRLTGLNRPQGILQKIHWKGIKTEKSPLELYYLVKHWVRPDHSKNMQCKEFFIGPEWIKNPSSKTKDCSRDFQRKMRDLYSIQPEFE